MNTSLTRWCQLLLLTLLLSTMNNQAFGALKLLPETIGAGGEVRLIGSDYLRDQNEFKAAEDNFRFAAETAQAQPFIHAHAQRYLGRALANQERIEEAIQAYKAAEQAYLDLGDTANVEQAWRAAADHGQAVLLAGEPEQAIEVLARAIAGIEDIRGDSHYNLIRPLTNLSAAQQASGQLTAAQSTAERAVNMAETILGPDHRFTTQAREQLENQASER